MTLFILDAGVHNQFIFFTIKVFEESGKKKMLQKMTEGKLRDWEQEGGDLQGRTALTLTFALYGRALTEVEETP